MCLAISVFGAEFFEQLAAAANAQTQQQQQQSSQLTKLSDSFLLAQDSNTETLSSSSIGLSTNHGEFSQNCYLNYYQQHHQQQNLARNSTKTLKCPKCNWHYKYQETLEIHMKEKHSESEVIFLF